MIYVFGGTLYMHSVCIYYTLLLNLLLIVLVDVTFISMSQNMKALKINLK